MAILSVALTRCLASFSFSLFFFQHNPPFIAPFKPKSHTARSWTHRHIHCVLINTCASTNTHCMLVNTFTQTHHSRHQKPLRLWPPQAHTLHTSMGFSFERDASALASLFGLFGVGLKGSEILLCVCVLCLLNKIWGQTLPRHLFVVFNLLQRFFWGLWL